MRYALFLLIALCFVPAAHAGIVDAPAANLEISLMTYGPGDIYWERFGHDALEVRDTVSGEAIAFNYGVFDFDQKGFILNFARGIMAYRMDAETTQSDVEFYSGEGRYVRRQRLALDNDQKDSLRRFLLWNVQPANAGYNYDYYADNCTTRVRDALDGALGGALSRQLRERPGGMTFREQTARLMSNQAWLMLGMDLGLGPYADQPMTAWKEAFLPMVLEDELRHVRIGDGADARPLVDQEDTLAQNKLDPPPEQAPDLRWPLLIAGLLWAIPLALPAFTRHRVARGVFVAAATLFAVFAGLAGLFMLGLWTLTLHRSAWGNFNLLAYQPFAFLLIPGIWHLRRAGRPMGRMAPRVAAMSFAACVIGLLLHLWPDFPQRNMPWLLLALPCWAALFASFCRKHD
ncbi:hypothetical protein BJI69_13085 [Luteibacter rhizovicinus DSM 16549]|uniref:Lnb N-terminal periplasmic domain-containing protein n=1 Tax=Luteibacter rhizovicinus DSM 16549 TaxID=1440763 RepID=A0A0G9HGE4_9GAMM|nr:DUF4105 domain-containing protein [Luteibacter rhizovicinus]APG04739.1 hypothetical protein BJI69_13085 [Luteibacter rhizovicinus DSM 16549]KLD68229.1 membrane protein [Luteibacter rhizovicinus DSM 16549]KLD78855.1 membrane protein [Xanthomonas hyacinthi DSM 19077]